MTSGSFIGSAAALFVGCAWAVAQAVTDDLGRPACRYRAKNFTEHDAMSAYVPSDGKVYAAAFPEAAEGRVLIVTGRAHAFEISSLHVE